MTRSDSTCSQIPWHRDEYLDSTKVHVKKLKQSFRDMRE